MVEVANHLNDVEFIVAKAPSAELSWYQNALKLAVNNNIEVVENNTYEILKMADAAIVTSGTATLETALLNVPQVVCYKGSWLSYQIGKRLVKIKYISLVNLIMDKQVVKELIQEKLTPQNLLTECNLLLYNSEYRNEIITNYALLRNKLNKKNAAKNTAGEIYNLLKL
jgi:lipid-A-disaccharide synthase